MCDIFHITGATSVTGVRSGSGKEREGRGRVTSPRRQKQVCAQRASSSHCRACRKRSDPLTAPLVTGAWCCDVFWTPLDQ
ncbi:hypothetical protein GN956_G9579 [Arapaima gigas]